MLIRRRALLGLHLLESRQARLRALAMMDGRFAVTR
jgi:hypothetical protein